MADISFIGVLNAGLRMVTNFRSDSSERGVELIAGEYDRDQATRRVATATTRLAID